ncbi:MULTISPECIES: ABC transporter permease [unclassified Mesorhizobium]|uniref:ABC transporter permease n=1 Tax=unclassified Mesorhizobium TaxID=325217 RepID=UPI0024156FDE|nr:MULTISPECIES: ABC transporter permease [unclassified Mesorhizobium]MDG4889973.1 ABC transporter permease [Mesorhizobium sp. WSM4887]MDG4904115.1 ABC transporter permease [Mesorhizobium sp. WSM4962]MDG4909142.1 ABC transporter permease [Mesorhizobium sp. WSM4898]MDG4921766.1 ABC transporter permease [Mesorhizobium sp. WSM4989]
MTTVSTSQFTGRRRLPVLGFGAILLAVIVGFSIAAPNFATVGNAFAMLHAMVPVTAAATGIALVIMSGKIDISIGSIAFLAGSIGGLLMDGGQVGPILGFFLILVIASLLGALNGFIVSVLGINSLITTLGTMITFRGIGLMLTEARVIPLPASIQNLGNSTLGPVFVDTLLLALLLVVVHYAHLHTAFGRHVTAVGNSEETSHRIGINTRLTSFVVFVLSGLFAGISASASFIQVGSITGFLGRGLEFNAIAVAVVGGISLSGGRGKILPGILLGALAFQVIFNGLNQVGANPYIYQLVTGAVIFVAMYVDAIKTRRQPT